MLADDLTRRDHEARAHRFRLQFWVTLLVAVVIIGAVYAIYHSVRYQNCAIKPGMFQWPSQCV